MPGQRGTDVDDRAVGCAFCGHAPKRWRTGIDTRVRALRKVGALARSGQRRWRIGVAMLTTGATRWSGRRRGAIA